MVDKGVHQIQVGTSSNPKNLETSAEIRITEFFSYAA